MEPKQAAAMAAADDRLSSLPAVLQDEILVRLGLRDAVRTSALSRAWRDRWKSLSVLSLSFPLGTHPAAVDSVLLRYIGPRVSLFHIYVDDASVGRVGDWLLALSRRRVESIHMRRQPRRGCFNLHSSIFSFAHLVSLRLQRCIIPPVPIGFAGFPALQELGLSSVHYSGSSVYYSGSRENIFEAPIRRENQLEAILRRSPLLHTLDMSDVPMTLVDPVIEAPNLCSLTISTEFDYGWEIGELPCLKDANIQVTFYPKYEHKFGDFLAPFAQVQNLTLQMPDTDVEMPTLPFNFYNLKNLKLYLDFTKMHPILSMFTLLRSCHNLEKLEIELRDNGNHRYEAYWELLNSRWTNGMCANLQVVQIMDISWLPIEISFMKLILSKARLLRTLYVDKFPDHFDDPLIDLLKCTRASAQARVLFEGLEHQF